VCDVHHTHISAVGQMVGPCVVINFGPGQAPIEIPADSHVDKIE
jgi:hypothetical protein